MKLLKFEKHEFNIMWEFLRLLFAAGRGHHPTNRGMSPKRLMINGENPPVGDIENLDYFTSVNDCVFVQLFNSQNKAFIRGYLYAISNKYFVVTGGPIVTRELLPEYFDEVIIMGYEIWASNGIWFAAQSGANGMKEHLDSKIQNNHFFKWN